MLSLLYGYLCFLSKAFSMTELIIIILGISLGFFIQTLLGFAAPLVALPLLLLVLHIQPAVAFVSVFSLLFCFGLFFTNWKFIDKKILTELSAGILAGTAFGVYLLRYGNSVFLKKFLGIFIILYVIYFYAIKGKEIKTPKYFGILFGFIGGIFSGMFSSGSPIFMTYTSNAIKQKEIIRATIIGALSVSHIFRIPFLFYANILTLDILIKSLYVLPFFIISVLLGQKLFNRLKGETYINLVMVFLFLSGLYVTVF